MTKYTLKKPVKVAEKELKEVTLRRPTGKDVRAIGNIKNLENTDTLVKMCATLGGLTLEEIDAIDGEDIFALFEVVTDFFGVQTEKLPTA